MARGGKRPGAGRKKDSKEHQTLIKEQALLRLRELAFQEIEPIAQKLIKEAKKGNIMAIREFWDRAWGKPPQSTELTGKDGKDLFEPSERIKELAEVLKRK